MAPPAKDKPKPKKRQPQAKKRLRQSFEQRDRNRAAKSALRTQLKKVREAIAKGDVAVAETEYIAASKRLAKAGAARLIHPNKASRLKSRLAQAIRKAKGEASEPATA